MTPATAETLAKFAPQTTSLGDGARVQHRMAGRAPRVTHVLLHGIGSASGSWLRQLEAADGRDDVRVLAWDAPGYGASTHLAPASPVAADYAERLWDWLDALGLDEPFVLAGHSLGALTAAAATLARPGRVAGVVLLSPARGYGDAPAAEREKKLGDRLATLQSLGPQGIADKRGSAMLSGEAPAALVAYVKNIMAAIDPAGYTQAARMLSTGQLGADIARVRAHQPALPFTVASGSADTITPPAGCQAVAREAGVPWQDLGEVGHACALEAAAQVTRLLGLAPTTKESA
ncbi:MAG: alpha/beta hydrolase [Burkholderiales bacterium]|jgi:pimeloyl-ACP methyl ester carboxylesterase|nr:alpha/beta hydrolase [Burkholderiales bacterium]